MPVSWDVSDPRRGVSGAESFRGWRLRGGRRGFFFWDGEAGR